MAERPTPFSVALCTLIAEHSDPSSSIHKPRKNPNTVNDADNGSNEIDLPDAAEEHLSKSIETLVAHADADSMSLSTLLDIIAGTNGRFSHSSEILLNFLNESCESIDALVDLFTALRSTVAGGIIDGDSAHGIYVRKRCLGFDELPFGSVGRFWESFCDYVHSANGWIKQMLHPTHIEHCDNESSGFKDDSMIIDGSDHCQYDNGEADGNPRDYTGTSNHWPLAPNQISRSLFQQCINLHKNIGMVPYEVMEAKIQHILRENPELTLAHYLRFLNDTMHGERVGALENFHRYFDYAMIQERKNRVINAPLPTVNISANNNSNGNMNAGNDNNQNQSATSGNIVQYSAILLSSLFHTFANDELALMATREATRIAQQTGDGACLAYALGWLNVSNNSQSYSSASNDTNSSLQALARTSTNAARYNIRSLVAGSSLLRANQLSMGGVDGLIVHGIRHPISLIPGQVWETISTASTEGVHINVIGATSFRPDVPSHVTNYTHSEELMTTFAQQQSASAGLWQCMGHSSMASTHFHTSMHCYKRYLSNDHHDLIAKEIAFSTLHGAGSEKFLLNDQVSSNYTSLCKSLERLRLNAPSIQQTSIYQNALQKLRAGFDDKLGESGIQWYQSLIMLLHESAIKKNSIQKAYALNTLLHSCIPLTDRSYAKASIEVLGQTCLLYCLQQRWQLAKCIICKSIIPLCEVNTFRYFHAYYLLQLSVIHCESNEPMKALSPILQCLSISERYCIDVIHASALSLLGRVHLELGNSSLAKSILLSSMPTIVQSSHLSFQGDTFLCMAKCILRETKELDKHTSAKLERKRIRLLKGTLSQLQKAQNAFDKSVDVTRLREVYYLLAQCHNSLPGHTSRRNVAAKRFQEMNSIKVQCITPSWFDALESLRRSVD